MVLFSERLATLDWLREALPGALGMPTGAFAVVHGQLPDRQQMAVVESFGLAAGPIRVLITGDVASEGVNLHKRCHNLVHVDIPLARPARSTARGSRVDATWDPVLAGQMERSGHVVKEERVLDELVADLDRFPS